MADIQKLSAWLTRFFTDFVSSERNYSINTKRSYRDTFIILLPYAKTKVRKSPENLSVTDLSPKLVRSFLDHVEAERGCSVETRNIRLAAIRSFARFVSSREPAYSDWCASLCAIGTKKTIRQKPLDWLSKEEMESIFQAVDTSKPQGKIEHALLVFLFNTGARVSEAIGVKVSDLQLHQNSSRHAIVTLHGKGGRVRQCPIWPKTAELLAGLIEDKVETDPVFVSQRRQPYSRYGVYRLVQRCNATVPSLSGRRITPHSIRHSCACNLLKSGVDLNTIRAWLGHVNLNTTNIYAQVDMELKLRAMQHCEAVTTQQPKSWKQDDRVMDFLHSL